MLDRSKLLLILLLCLHLPAHALSVLSYPHLAERTPAHSGAGMATFVSPADFAKHMAWLEKHQFRVLSMIELQALIKRGESLPDMAVVITFDGAWKSVLEHAVPQLKQRRWPYTLFVQTKAHDEKNPLVMSWDELKKLSREGATIANLSDSYPHLIRQQHYENFSSWQQRREREIEFAEQRILSMIGSSHRLLAYPWGEYDAKLVERLRELGYLAFSMQAAPIDTASHPQILPRFAFTQNIADEANFVLRVTGLPFPQSRISVTSNDGSALKEPALPEPIARPLLRIASPIMPYAQSVSCFVIDSANRLQPLKAEIRGSSLTASATDDLAPGRNYYSCLVGAGGGRHFWHSQLFIRRQPNGDWPGE